MRLMKIFLLLASLLWLGSLQVSGEQAPQPQIDWNKAQQLFRQEQRGESLAPEDRAYLDRAKEMRRRNSGGGGNPTAGQRSAPSRQVPLCDMSSTGRYEGEDGGLYGQGLNTPPDALRKAAEKQLALIRPLDANGNPAADGTIGFVSISMSNATMEFSTFKRLADASPLKSEKVTIVDCAQGGQTMERWAAPDGNPWEVAMKRLASAGVDPRQVQVAWIKLANGGPRGSLQEHGRKLEADALATIRNAKAKFPNLRIAYLASRIWGGAAKGALNPEPYAFEGAFAVRWLIQRQLRADEALTLDKAPLLLWGPYLWADGQHGRKLDSLVWTSDDFIDDGVHPTPAGRQKVASLLLDFFTSNDLAKGWFAK